MWQRWRLIGIVVAGLFAVTAIARLIVQFAIGDDEKLQSRIGTTSIVVIGAVVAVLSFLAGRRYPQQRIVLDLGGAVLISCLLAVLLGPLITGDNPFGRGAGVFFGQIWIYLGAAIGGGLLGTLVVMAFGLDYRAQALKLYARTESARPRRPARR